MPKTQKQNKNRGSPINAEQNQKRKNTKDSLPPKKKLKKSKTKTKQDKKKKKNYKNLPALSHCKIILTVCIKRFAY